MTDERLPAGISREPDRTGYVVQVRVRPYPLRRKRFPLETPIAVMVAWRKAQRAELRAYRDAGRLTPPPPEGIIRVEETTLAGALTRIAGALERIATAMDGRAQ